MAIRGEKKNPHYPESELIFAIGHALEPVIIKHAGYDLSHWFSQDEGEARLELIPGVVAVGHPDAEIQDGLFKIILECKTMNPFQFKKLKTEALINSHPQYFMQLMIYVLGRNADYGRFLVLDKGDSKPKIHQETYSREELIPFYLEAQARAEKILKYATSQNKRLPGKDKNLPNWACMKRYCQFWGCRYNEFNTAKGIAIYKAKKKKEKEGAARQKNQLCQTGLEVEAKP